MSFLDSNINNNIITLFFIKTNNEKTSLSCNSNAIAWFTVG